MKRMTAAALFLAAALALPFGCAAEESIRIDGTIEAVKTQTILAPHSGRTGDFSVRSGDALQAGDLLFTLSATPVYAEFDGTITGLFAQAGDSTASVQERYGALCFMEREHLYTVDASTTGAASDNENKIIHIGEKVYIKCAPDGTHKAEGIVTSVSGSDYVVQATAGELYMDEKVYIYRANTYKSEVRLGSGKVNRTEAVAVPGSGSLLKIHVEDGEEVERGQLLFECVDGDLDALIANGDVIQSTADGVIAQVNVAAGQKIEKGAVLLTVYQTQDYQIAFSVTEEELPYVNIGDQASIYFNWNSENSTPYEGVVTDLSYVGETNENGEVVYQGYIAFQADDTVRLGMNVTVMLDE